MLHITTCLKKFIEVNAINSIKIISGLSGENKTPDTKISIHFINEHHIASSFIPIKWYLRNNPLILKLFTKGVSRRYNDNKYPNSVSPIQIILSKQNYNLCVAYKDTDLFQEIIKNILSNYQVTYESHDEVDFDTFINRSNSFINNKRNPYVKTDPLSDDHYTLFKFPVKVKYTKKPLIKLKDESNSTSY